MPRIAVMPLHGVAPNRHIRHKRDEIFCFQRLMISRAAIVATFLLATSPASAAEAPYEPGLLRLSEVLGSLHFLRNLCGEKGTGWRDEMEKLLDAEKPDATRRSRFIASFNHGYRSFQTIYSTCTPAASEAIDRYVKEGEALARDISGRYGN